MRRLYVHGYKKHMVLKNWKMEGKTAIEQKALGVVANVHRKQSLIRRKMQDQSLTNTKYDRYSPNNIRRNLKDCGESLSELCCVELASYPGRKKLFRPGYEASVECAMHMHGGSCDSANL